MRKLTSVLLMTVAASAAYAGPAEILDANRAAMGGAAWDGKSTFSADYAYSGQGMTGKVSSLADLRNGYWADNFAIGPATGANGFDGEHAWQKDQSGTVTIQDGGDQRPLAVNEGYRRANLWWRADRGGAAIVDDGEKREGDSVYDVLTVTPPGGKNFDAWFDAKSHLLSRVIEVQGAHTLTTTWSHYEASEGVEVARSLLQNNGDSKYDETETATRIAFGPPLGRAAFEAPKVTVADYAIAGDARETTFPFRLINNHIYADVEVDGKGPFQFIFDTGGVNLITPSLATRLGLKSEGQMEGNGTGAGHMDVGLTKVDALTVGAATVKGQVFFVMALDKMADVEGVGMPGMVGYETFRRFVTRIDYGRRTITLIRPDAFDASGAGIAVPITFNGNTIEADAVYGGIKGNFTIDTGSRASLTLNGPFAASHHLNRDNRTIDAVTGWGVGGASRSLAMRGEPLVLGGMTIANPVVELSTDKGGDFTADSLAGNIGAGILKRYVVTLDYEHRVLYLKPLAGRIADLDTFDRAGMWINVSDGGFDIVDVTRDAPADQAGLKPGDEIVAVNGTPSAALKLYDVRQMLRDETPGTVVIFTVRRGGETVNAAVTLRDLI